MQARVHVTKSNEIFYKNQEQYRIGGHFHWCFIFVNKQQKITLIVHTKSDNRVSNHKKINPLEIYNNEGISRQENFHAYSKCVLMS